MGTEPGSQPSHRLVCGMDARKAEVCPLNSERLEPQSEKLILCKFCWGLGVLTRALSPDNIGVLLLLPL